MLASAETIEVVADALIRYGQPVSVVDPVLSILRAVLRPI